MFFPGKQEARMDEQVYQMSQRYCMSHYKDGTGGTGMDYIGQAVLAFAMVGGSMLGLLTAVLHRTTIDILVAASAMIVGAIWLLYSVNRWIDRALEAKSFAQSAVVKLKSADEIEAFFDKTYPWIFH